MLYYKFYTATEAAEILNVTPECVGKWCKQGKLKGIRTPDHLYISEHELDRFLGREQEVFRGNENVSADGEPLGALAEAQLPLVALDAARTPELVVQAA